MVSVAFAPAVAAKLAVADALASRRTVAYTLKGTMSAVPEDAKLRSFDVDSRNTLSPMPGLQGVLR